jgi:hypothetical protein
VNTPSVFQLPILGFLLTLAFGFWLSKAGRPYNGLLFNIHKLIALGAMILTAVRMYQMLQLVQWQSLLVALIILAILSIVALFASGAAMSIGTVRHNAMKLVHNIAPVVLVISMGWSLLLLA